MYPIRGGTPRLVNPYAARNPVARAVGSVGAVGAMARAADLPTDVELSIRLLADGGRVTVKRRIVTDADGVTHTVGIDAVIR